MKISGAGNQWTGDDPEEHARQHQMGFDYALYFLEGHKKESGK